MQLLTCSALLVATCAGMATATSPVRECDYECPPRDVGCETYWSWDDCCELCYKTEGQPCGGQYWKNGFCGSGLKCEAAEGGPVTAPDANSYLDGTCTSVLKGLNEACGNIFWSNGLCRENLRCLNDDYNLVANSTTWALDITNGTCARCSRMSCPELSCDPAEQTWSQTSCCKECPQQTKGQVCGGPYWTAGRCEEGSCLTPDTDDPVEGDGIGVPVGYCNVE